MPAKQQNRPDQHGWAEATYRKARKKIFATQSVCAICGRPVNFDLRFPEWCRYRGDYDAMLCVANWPEQRIAAWDVLTRARAIENQCLVVAANRCGNDPANHYSGHSAIIDAWGNVLAADERHTATAITANFDLEEQQMFRQKFPVLKHL